MIDVADAVREGAVEELGKVGAHAPFVEVHTLDRLAREYRRGPRQIADATTSPAVPRSAATVTIGRWPTVDTATALLRPRPSYDARTQRDDASDLRVERDEALGYVCPE